MNAKFIDLNAAADFLGPGAVEVNRYQNEITDIVRRRGVFGQRIKQVPATGHPSRFFEQTAIVAPSAANAFVDPRSISATVGSPTRVERSVPLKAMVSQINYNLFDLEVGAQQSQFAFLQAKDLADSVEGLLRTNDVALWNGTDTSLSSPTTLQYFGAIGQISAGGNTHTLATTDPIVDNLKAIIANMVASSSFEVRPTAIYANPVLLDLIDREMKTEFNVVLSTTEINGGLRVKALSTQAGDIPLIPEWSLSFTGTPGSGTAVLPCYIVTEDMIEYHWLTDPNPRVFQLGLPGSLASQMVVVKFGGIVVKGASYAHTEVKVPDKSSLVAGQWPLAFTSQRPFLRDSWDFMNYLVPSDYEAYGIEATTPLAWVTSASALIDSHCRRTSLTVTQYTERLRITAGRNTAQLSYLPLAVVSPAVSPIVSVRGRYAIPRRGETPFDDLTLNIATAFSLPGTWTNLDPSAIEAYAATGELMLPINPIGLVYSEVEVVYTAGFDVLPDAVKVACAQIVRNAQTTPALNVRSGQIDRLRLDYFSDTLLDQTVRTLLAPYVAQKVA